MFKEERRLQEWMKLPSDGILGEACCRLLPVSHITGGWEASRPDPGPSVSSGCEKHTGRRSLLCQEREWRGVLHMLKD